LTTLFVHELKTELEQEFKYKLRTRMNIGGVRPYLYIHNNPVGTFTIELLYNSSPIATGTFTAADIKTALATSDNYVHAYYNVTLDKNPVLNHGIYSLKLTSSGYSFNESAYIGWIALHENERNEMEYTPESDGQNSLTFELWEHKYGANT
jgi:hypothetical protein